MGCHRLPETLRTELIVYQKGPVANLMKRHTSNKNHLFTPSSFLNFLTFRFHTSLPVAQKWFQSMAPAPWLKHRICNMKMNKTTSKGQHFLHTALIPLQVSRISQWISVIKEDVMITLSLGCYWSKGQLFRIERKAKSHWRDVPKL